MFLKRLFQNSKFENALSEKDLRWNRFIKEICSKRADELNDIQNNAAMAFWYSAEMNSGGHSGYFDCYPETDPQKLYDALAAIGVPEVADNYQQALLYGKEDDYIQTDKVFGNLEPTFFDSLTKYVELHHNEIGV